MADLTPTNASEEAREEVERDIRIAIWNAGMNGGMGQNLTQALIRRAMAEPLMVRALSAFAKPSPDTVSGEVERAAQIADVNAEIFEATNQPSKAEAARVIARDIRKHAARSLSSPDALEG